MHKNRISILAAILLLSCTPQGQSPLNEDVYLHLIGTPETYSVEGQVTLIENIRFQAPGAWKASVAYMGQSGWMSLDPESGAEGGEISMQARLKVNSSGEDRNAVISIHCGKDDRIKLTVSQSSIEGIDIGNLTVTSPKLGSGMANPLVDYTFCADPTAIEYEGRLYVYGTNDYQQYQETSENTYEKIKSLVVLSTEDMVNWTYNGVIPVGEIAPWISASWAPSIVCSKKPDGSPLFSLFFSNSGWGVGVLEADHPLGPWTSPLDRSLIDGNDQTVKGSGKIFDPGAVVDENGTGWLAFGGTQGWIAKLAPDMHSFAESPVKLPSPFHFEANELNVINGTFVYTYNNDWSNHSPWAWSGTAPASCSMVCFKSVDPLRLDSWTYGGMYFKNPGHNGLGYGNNHTHLHKYHGKWYLLYHTGILQESFGTEGGFRCLHADEIEVDEDNVYIKECVPSYAGVSAIKNLDAFVMQSAATASATQNIIFNSTETVGQMTAAVGSPRLKADAPQAGIIEVRNVDFGDNAVKITCRLKGQGRMSIRTDGFDGEDLAIITGTGSTWDEKTEDCFHSLSGVHTLYFILEKGLELDSWKFSR